ncbi:hypothetical protein F4813DRAFT_361929 [Daldinia decipiens]|uniref:uncharacterized protein n=1 Tax=Daldinia decipiens TaxID=326647 RepID=UPI0020C3D2FD|nr:uncharacterized protein F4813DRAFT_361929 [Daldinia decipiens]KAI1656807.1 hypothetical protein F4813DRAFT_361929 [Daldinia decipiens]
MFGLACHKCSKLLLEVEPTNPVASSMATGIARRNMILLKPYSEGRFKRDSSEAEKITITDCVFFSFL